MSWTSVEDDLYASLTALMPTLSVIIADQNGAEKVTPYCMINVVMHDQVGREQEHTYVVDATENEPCQFVAEIHETFETTVRFVFIGKELDSENAASNLAYKFLSLLSSSQGRYRFARNNLSVMRKNPVRRSPVVRETDRYNAYTVEAVFAYCLKTTETIDWFDTVSVSGNLTGSVIDPHVIDEFTIPS